MSDPAPAGAPTPARGPQPPLPKPVDVCWAWAPALAYMALIFVLSSMHIQPEVIDELPFKDKLVHTIEYAVLGGLCAHASRRTWPRHAVLRTALLGVFLAVAFGVSDELHQSFVPGRNADLQDIVADALGAMIGALFSVLWGRWRRR